MFRYLLTAFLLIAVCTAAPVAHTAPQRVVPHVRRSLKAVRQTAGEQVDNAIDEAGNVVDDASDVVDDISDETGLSRGAIIGIAVGCAAVVVLAILLIICCCCGCCCCF